MFFSQLPFVLAYIVAVERRKKIENVAYGKEKFPLGPVRGGGSCGHIYRLIIMTGNSTYPLTEWQVRCVWSVGRVGRIRLTWRII